VLGIHDRAIDRIHRAIVCAVNVAGERACDRPFNICAVTAFLPHRSDNHAYSSGPEAEQPPAWRKISLPDQLGRREDVMQIRQRLKQARCELSQPDVLPKRASRTANAPKIGPAFEQTQLHLPVVRKISQEVTPRRLAFDKAGLMHTALRRVMMQTGGENSRPHRINDPHRLEANLGRDALVSNAVHPPAGFFFQQLMKIGLARHILIPP